MNTNKFQGRLLSLSSNWNDIIPIRDIPINYLEIGVLHGSNLISVAKTYAKNKDSKIYAVDLWQHYKEYPERPQSLNGSTLSIFKQNLKRYNINNVNIIKDYSNNALIKLDKIFDMIYIDGNHATEYVLLDAILAFRILKHNGYIIFDDYGWKGVRLAVDFFIQIYKDKLKVLKMDLWRNTKGQAFIQKIDDNNLELIEQIIKRELNNNNEYIEKYHKYFKNKDYINNNLTNIN